MVIHNSAQCSLADPDLLCEIPLFNTPFRKYYFQPAFKLHFLSPRKKDNQYKTFLTGQDIKDTPFLIPFYHTPFPARFPANIAEKKQKPRSRE
ncbi:MAG: hypothetical protein ONB12_03490 [candidate division KSB1 bacterium]|nr:hypothetical protein [candidate division KSB1 bacterium]